MGVMKIIIGLSNLILGLVCIVLSMPLLQRKVKRNHWYGFRIRKAFESEDNWYKINEYAARRLILWCAILAFIGLTTFVLPLNASWQVIALAFAPLILIVPMVETYLYAQRLD